MVLAVALGRQWRRWVARVGPLWGPTRVQRTRGYLADEPGAMTSSGCAALVGSKPPTWATLRSAARVDRLVSQRSIYARAFVAAAERARFVPAV